MDDDTNRVQVRISPKPYKKVTGHLRGEPDAMDELRDAITSDEVDVGQAELLYRDGMYSLHVTVTREFDVPELNTSDTLVGVDINERNVALTALDRNTMRTKGTLVLGYGRVKQGCKHTGTVGRPVVQKLYSAIATFDFDGPKRGMVVTTGRFTNPAEEYAQRLQQNDDLHPIELLDGEDLREIADEIGLDLYNGRIEILCDETLRPYDSAADVDAPVEEAFRDVEGAFRDIENIEAADLPEPHSSVTFRPVVAVTADTNAVFETSVGVIHRINDQAQFVAHAERGQPQVVDEDVATLATENLHATVDLDSEQFGEVFDDVEERRFGQTQTEYKEWAVDRLQQHHTTTASIGASTVTRAESMRPTPTVRTAGPSPAPATLRPNGWKASRSVRAVR